MASVDEINAAFDVLEVILHKLVKQVPWPFADKAMAALESPDGRRTALDGTRRMLTAAELVRASAAAKGSVKR